MLAIYDPRISNHRFAAPNKFYESLMLGKPVIMVKGTGMSSIVEENDIGAVIDYSEDSFQDGLNRICERKEEWESMGEVMRSIYNNNFDWRIMEARLLKLYNEIV